MGWSRVLLSDRSALLTSGAIFGKLIQEELLFKKTVVKRRENMYGKWGL